MQQARVGPGAATGGVSGQEAAASGQGGGGAAAATTTGPAFLRLSSDCRPSLPGPQLVYLDRDEVTFGRLPTSTVVLDSSRAPQMISRTHGIVRRSEKGRDQAWLLVSRGMNGILVNDVPVSSDGHDLQPGDVITFGRKMQPPEFEYVFEAPHSTAAKAEAEAAAAAEAEAEEAFGEQMRKIEELQRELEAEREQKRAELAARASSQRRQSKSALNLTDLSSELACSICQDWLVHAATIECSHTFCWSCIDKWLLHKKFECPVCRSPVTREPVKTRAVEAIVRKTVDKLPDDQKAEYDERVSSAEAAQERARLLHAELEKSVGEAMRKGKAFFHIASSWKKKERETFQRGIKDYTGDTRETYCRLTGLTVQWVHSAGDTNLNQALHNLGLQAFVSSPLEEIRQRLLMFLRYG